LGYHPGTRTGLLGLPGYGTEGVFSMEQDFPSVRAKQLLGLASANIAVRLANSPTPSPREAHQLPPQLGKQNRPTLLFHEICTRA